MDEQAESINRIVRECAHQEEDARLWLQNVRLVLTTLTSHRVNFSSTHTFTDPFSKLKRSYSYLDDDRHILSHLSSYLGNLNCLFVRRYNPDRYMGVKEEQVNETLHTMQTIGLIQPTPFGDKSRLYAPFTKLV
jgi:hypothetical protein